MSSYIKLSVAALLPVIATIIFSLFKKTNGKKSDNVFLREIIVGVVFGIIAIIGTEWGIPMSGAQVNCRDAAVICAGLFFGGPAGIIAGFIGGIERWIAVAWGVGTFTRVACSVSTIAAGFISAFLRKYFFENRRPSWPLAFSVGVSVEVFHLTMVFVTNMNDSERAIAVIKACTIPMVIANGVSVLICAIAITLLNKEKLFHKKEDTKVSQTVQKWLFLAVAVAFLLTSFFVYELQSKMAQSQIEESLQFAVADVKSELEDINKNESIKQTLPDEIKRYVSNRHVGKSGYMFITDKNLHLVCNPQSINTVLLASSLSTISSDEKAVFESRIAGVDSFVYYEEISDVLVFAVIDKDEGLRSKNIALYANTFMEILSFAVLFLLVFFIVKKVVVLPIQSINESLDKISNGDFNEEVNVRGNSEFAALSNDINSTVGVLKDHIAQAAARIEEDLQRAKDIQMSALQTIFPAFPNRKDFDIYASTTPAKEVGGDFYDMYMTHSRYLNFLIADVSGKGIPAAMFMMRAKTVLQSLTKTDMLLNEVYTEGNNSLCEGNDAGMFVTAWQGGLDLRDGTLEFVNAGHNPPIIRRASTGKFELYRSKVNFVLAGMENAPYKMQEIKLDPGDIIFLYTDGVTEAINEKDEFYGEERLVDSLNERDYIDMNDMCNHVKSKLSEFVGDAAQFDDITVLGLKYHGKNAPRWFALDAKVSEIPRITSFADKMMEKMGCSFRTQAVVDVAIDEIMTNIASYAYDNNYGRMGIEIRQLENPSGIEVKFIDTGKEYNPLSHADPDTTLSVDERQIGGLGLLMVKKSMDKCSYERINGTNVFTIVKYFEE